MPHEPDGVIDFGATPSLAFVNGTGDQNIDGVLQGVKWADPALTFSFPSVAADYDDGNYPNFANLSAGFSAFTATQETAMRWWLDLYASVSGLTFTELDGPAGAQDEDQEATLRFANSTNAGSAFGKFPGSAAFNGDSWYDTAGDNPVFGNKDWMVLGHELGHNLGLKHGHAAGGIAGAMNSDRDSREFSIMTYREYIGAPTNDPYSLTNNHHPQSLMMYDIAAIQDMYGANFNSNSGSTTYSFDPLTGAMSVNGTVGSEGAPAANIVFRTIWDGNGSDTYDFSNYTTNLAVDLRPGFWTDLDVGGNAQRSDLGNGNFARGHVFNALQYQGDARSLIENANGGSGDDTITGNSAGNVLHGGDGGDTIYGGDGNDFLHADDGAAGSPPEGLYGGDGIDVLYGDDSAKATNFFGGDENDIIFAGSVLHTNDDFFGGAGNDHAYFTEISAGGTFVMDSAGTADIAGFGTMQFESFESLTATTGDDSITGDTSGDYISGAAGADSIDGNSGDDTLYGGSGNDTILDNSGDSTLDGGDDDDTLIINEDGGDYTVTGGDGSDLLDVDGSGGWDVSLVSGTGTALGGVATVDFAEIENLFGSLGDDTLTGDSAANTITATGGDDTLYGGRGADVLEGNDGRDEIYAGIGADLIIQDEDGDTNTIDGGDGTDLLDLSAFATNLVIGSGFVYGGTTTLVTSALEELVLGTGDDQVLSGTFSFIDLSDGTDQLTIALPVAAGSSFIGGTGRDTITLNTATDADINLATGSIGGITALSGFENVISGVGNDTVTGSTSGNGLFGGLGNDTVSGGGGRDTVSGNNGRDALFGGAADDELWGGLQSDRLNGGSQNDSVYGEGGNDTLIGGSGNDTLDGDAGTDTLTGGTGTDTLTGGTEDDVFIFAPGHTTTGSGQDEITDFTSAADRIDLTAFGTLTWLDEAAFDGTGPQVRQELGSGLTVLEIDADGDGTEDAQIILQGLGAGIFDFDLILAP